MNDELAEKLSLALSRKLLNPKEDSALEKIKIYAGITASIATLIAAVIAFIASQQALAIKSVLDDRQLLLDEQARIGAIYFISEGKINCVAIPLDEVVVWEEYRACMFGENHRYNKKLSFLKSPDQNKRNTCLIDKTKYCR